MVFLLRAGFWVVVVWLLLPPGAVAPLPHGPRIDTAGLVTSLAATSAAGAARYCAGHAETCRSGLAAAQGGDGPLAAGAAMLTAYFSSASEAETAAAALPDAIAQGALPPVPALPGAQPAPMRIPLPVPRPGSRPMIAAAAQAVPASMPPPAPRRKS